MRLIRAIRRNIETLEAAVATANHSIVQSRAMLIRLERLRTREDDRPLLKFDNANSAEFPGGPPGCCQAKIGGSKEQR